MTFYPVLINFLAENWSGSQERAVCFSNLSAPEKMIYRVRSDKGKGTMKKAPHYAFYLARTRIISDVVISIPLSWKSDNKSLLIKRFKEFHPSWKKIYTLMYKPTQGISSHFFAYNCIALRRICILNGED